MAKKIIRVSPSLLAADFLHLKKDVNYGSYGDWIKTNEVTESEIKLQYNKKFDINPKISIIVPMYNTKEKFLNFVQKMNALKKTIQYR